MGEDLIMYNTKNARAVNAICFTKKVILDFYALKEALPSHRANGASDHVCVVVELSTQPVWMTKAQERRQLRQARSAQNDWQKADDANAQNASPTTKRRI